MARLRLFARAVVVSGLGLLAVLPWTAAPAVAQSNDVRALVANIQRLERALNSLEGYVYGGWRRPEGAGATQAPGAGATSQQAARLQVGLAELETELRNLTGRVEELRFKIDKVGRRLDKLVEDVDFRLTALERDLARSLEVAARGPASATAPGPEQGLGPGAGTSVRQPGPPPDPQTLGTISAADLAAATAARAAPPPEPKKILPEGTPKERYEFARRLLRQGDWGEAGKAFQEFIAAHPDDGLTGNAQYWLGETFYVRRDFDLAATNFLEGYQKFPTSPKAPDSLLKLGMSLVNLGLKQEACQTFAEVLDKHADAPASITRLVGKERKRAGCP